MAVIINFQEYTKAKRKRNDDVKTDNVLSKNGQIIYFNREDVGL